ncbi:hypothetical protein [Embleya sp. NPDC050493]
MAVSELMVLADRYRLTATGRPFPADRCGLASLADRHRLGSG